MALVTRKWTLNAAATVSSAGVITNASAETAFTTAASGPMNIYFESGAIGGPAFPTTIKQPPGMWLEVSNDGGTTYRKIGVGLGNGPEAVTVQNITGQLIRCCTSATDTTAPQIVGSGVIELAYDA